MTDWASAARTSIATVLLGSWPSLVNSWGREAIAAYVAELEARGLTPDDALQALRMCDGQFPPSAPELAALARRDPYKPTWAEAFTAIEGVLKTRTRLHKVWWEAGERDRLDDEARWEAAAGMHPLIGAFIRAQGLDRLRRLNFDDPEFGAARRKQLGDEWEEFVEAHETRDVAELVAGRRGQLGRFDPLRALGPRRLGLEERVDDDQKREAS